MKAYMEIHQDTARMINIFEAANDAESWCIARYISRSTHQGARLQKLLTGEFNWTKGYPIHLEPVPEEEVL